MYLKEMKEKVLSLIEEINPESELLTDDPDISAKINTVIQQVQTELARMKKIPFRIVKQIEESEELQLDSLEQFYQLEIIHFVNKEGKELEVNTRGKYVQFNEPGVATIYYYKYPKRIDKDTKDEEYEFELSDDALEIMPYGVAGDLLKSDVSNGYGQIYSNRYETMLQRLDPRYDMGKVFIDTSGLDDLGVL